MIYGTETSIHTYRELDSDPLLVAPLLLSKGLSLPDVNFSPGWEYCCNFLCLVYFTVSLA